MVIFNVGVSGSILYFESHDSLSLGYAASSLRVEMRVTRSSLKMTFVSP